MNSNPKPLLRGHFHQAAFFMALGASFLLVLKSLRQSSFAAVIVYSCSLVTLLGVSALYHRVNWEPSTRAFMRRLDHASIYFLIAGTLTPICLKTLPTEQGKKLLTATWIVAGVGMLLSIAFSKKPKWLNTLLAASAPLVALPFIPDMARGLGATNITLMLIGGGAYLIGAMAYAFKRPNFFPKIFGYHEVFHVLVLVGAFIHFAVIHSLL